VSGGSLFVGLWAPPGTPAAVVTRLNRDFVAALANEQFARFLDRFGYERASTVRPEQLAELTRTSIDHWRPFIASLGIKLEP
jgi:tripartite-type tricarboxylate transporter receptor subunit TctC